MRDCGDEGKADWGPPRANRGLPQALLNYFPPPEIKHLFRGGNKCTPN